MKNLKDIRHELLADPEVQSEYRKQAPEFDMAHELIAARARAGLTQSDVADRMGTTQSVIARLEGGKQAPSLRTVQRYVRAVGARAVMRIETLPVTT